MGNRQKRGTGLDRGDGGGRMREWKGKGAAKRGKNFSTGGPLKGGIGRRRRYDLIWKEGIVTFPD